jgi:hypothetical protein
MKQSSQIVCILSFFLTNMIVYLLMICSYWTERKELILSYCTSHSKAHNSAERKTICWFCFAFHITKSINHNNLEACLRQSKSAILPHWRFGFDSRGLHFPILLMIQFCGNHILYFHWQWDYPIILIYLRNCSKRWFFQFLIIVSLWCYD